MPLEIGSTINDLTPSNPLAGDPAGQGDDHLRLIKSCVQATLPNMGAVLGQVRRQDVALSISAIWNTNHFICSASATATVVLTLPPAASITSGFYVDITTIGTGTVSLLPSGAASVNGGVSLSIPRLNSARAYFVGGLAWQADVVPHGNGGYVLGGNVIIDGTLSVSGAAVLSTTLIVKGSMTISGATVLAGGLSVSGATVLSGALSVSGATVLTGALTVSGAASISGSTFLNGALTVAGTTTLSGTVVLSNGQLKFPATQNASADANTLDDYEEGTWTPVLTTAVPGTLAVTYLSRSGEYTKIGNQVRAALTLFTSSVVLGTASGEVRVTGFPFTPAALAVGSGPYFQGLAAGAARSYATVMLSSNAYANVYSCETTTGAGAALMTAGNLSGAAAPAINSTYMYNV